MGKRGMTPKQAEELRLKRDIGRGAKLRVVRVKRGLSQIELAEVSGVKVQSIRRFEQNPNSVKETRLDTLCALSEALDCKITDIIDDKELVERFNKVK